MNTNRYFSWDSQMNRNRGYNRGGGGRGRRNFRGPYGNFGGRGGNNRPYYNNYDRNEQPWKKPQERRETPGKRLSEEDIGITEYVSDHEGFNGIIKSRYSDFQVAEINENGEIAKLTNQEPPEPPADETVDEDEDLLLNKYNVEILPMDTWDRINKLAVCTEPSAEKVEIDVTGMSKEQRTKIHDAVKKAFGESIVGSTVNIDDKKFVRFEKYRKGVRIDNRVKWVWPGEYVRFIVHKENCDTMDVAVKIAEKLRMNLKASMIGYAGTKDRRAKTSQWFSVRRVEPRRVVAAGRALPGVHVGDFRFSDTHLRLGMLRGNRFRIALRNVTADDEHITKACENFRTSGFINYYGLQRFGTRADVPTYEIGLKMLQGNFKEAIDAILSPRAGPLQQALRLRAGGGGERGVREAVRAVPRYALASIEGRLLAALHDHPNDLLGAINKLGRNTRLLYLHSYQSWVWNRAVSERLRRHQLRPAVGDLVLLQDDYRDKLEDEDSDTEDNEIDKHDTSEKDAKDKEDQEKNATDKDATDKDAKVKDVSVKDASNNEDSKQAENKSKNKKKKEPDAPKPKIPVKILTQEDLDSNKYTIYDIVMPLPGYNIDYPPNMKDYIEELLKKDNLTLEMRHKIKSCSMSGAYRHILARAADVEWRCVRYDDPYGDLLLSDLDEPRDLPDKGKYKALLLTMTLPASCYATMALRELLKVDTSGDNQALQNNYHKVKERSETDADSSTDGATNVTSSEGSTAENVEPTPETESSTVKAVKTEDSMDSEEQNSGEKRKLEEEEGAAKRIKHESEQ